MGLYTPTILGGNSHLSWFYDRGAIKDPTHTGTTKGLSQAINRGPIGKFLPNYANVYITIQSHAPSAGARTHYVTANGVRNGPAETWAHSQGGCTSPDAPQLPLRHPPLPKAAFTFNPNQHLTYGTGYVPTPVFILYAVFFHC